MKIEDVPKISDVIKQLEELKKECGDLPLTMECVNDDGSTQTCSVDFKEDSMSMKTKDGFKTVWVIDVHGDSYID